MNEELRPEANKIEGIPKYDNSLAAAYAHFFSDTVLPVSFFHAGHGVLIRQDGSSGTNTELSSDDAQAGCKERKRAFLERMGKIDFGKLHAYGPVDKDFVERVIQLASGDWNDPNLIAQLVSQFRSVCHLWQK
ncbi:MAG: hypothetical protein AAB899_03220 [Patescibacteria group bacterium]